MSSSRRRHGASLFLVSAGIFAGAILAADAASAQPAAPPPAPAPAPAAAAPAAPAGANVTSMRDALRRLEHDNLEIEAARHDLGAARADIIAAGVLTNPNLAVNAAFLLHGVQAQGDTSYNITVDQVIPIGGQIGLREDVARGYASAAEREFAATVWTLMGNVRDAYVDLQALQARFRALSAGIEDLSRIERIITERTKAGANPTYDRVRVELEKADLVAQLTATTSGLAAARVALAQAIGRGVDAGALVADEIPDDLPEPPTSVPALMNAAVARRSEIAAAKLRASAADRKITQIRREYFPSPDVAVGYSGWRGIPTEDGKRAGGALYVGVTIPLPLFDHGQGKVDRAASEANAARSRAEAAELQIRREVERASASMTNQVIAWRKYREIASTDVDSLRTMAEVSYKEGKGGIMELLDAYRTHLGSKLRAIELKVNAWQAVYDLERAIGPAPQ